MFHVREYFRDRKTEVECVLFQSNAILLYEDSNQALFMPGVHKDIFDLLKYNELGQDYRKICPYLCTEEDFNTVWESCNGVSTPINTEEEVSLSSFSFWWEGSTLQSPVDADTLYASWLFEERNRPPLSSDLEGKETNHDLAVKCSLKGKADPKDIIGQLARFVNLGKMSKFNITPRNVWEVAVRDLCREIFRSRK